MTMVATLICIMSLFFVKIFTPALSHPDTLSGGWGCAEPKAWRQTSPAHPVGKKKVSLQARVVTAEFKAPFISGRQRQLNACPHHATNHSHTTPRCCKGKRGRWNILTRYHRYLEWKTSRSVHRRLWRNIKSSGSEAMRKVMQPLRVVLRFKKLTGCMTIQKFHPRRTKSTTTEASL